MIRPPPSSTLFPSTTLSRSRPAPGHGAAAREARRADGLDAVRQRSGPGPGDGAADRDGIDSRIRAPVVATHELDARAGGQDRKSTRLNSSHGYISYAVFCLQ